MKTLFAALLLATASSFAAVDCGTPQRYGKKLLIPITTTEQFVAGWVENYWEPTIKVMPRTMALPLWDVSEDFGKCFRRGNTTCIVTVRHRPREDTDDAWLIIGVQDSNPSAGPVLCEYWREDLLDVDPIYP